VTIETLTLANLDELAALVGRACDLDELSAEHLRRKLFADPEQNPELILAARESGRLVGVAVGVARSRDAGRVGYVRLVATDPAFRRRGIATGLLDELERRLVADGATQIDVGGEGPVFLFPGVEVGYTAALCLFERRGYRIAHETSNMVVELAGRDFCPGELEARLAGQGIAIRPLVAADRAELDTYLSARWSAGWRHEALEALDVDPPTGFLAQRDGQIVGFAVYDVSRPGWFGPTGTDEELRGRGIGAALLRRCLAAWQTAGRERGEICWTRVWSFYAKVADARIGRWYLQLSRGGEGE
jgi:mycothiol synthase